MSLFDGVLDLRGILGGSRPLCAKCRDEGRRTRMEAGTTYSRKFAAEVSAWVCPRDDCNHAVMREEGGEVRLSHGEFADTTEWRRLR